MKSENLSEVANGHNFSKHVKWIIFQFFALHGAIVRNVEGNFERL